MSETLVLAVKRKWFDLIKSGEKKFEYRLCNEHWQKRIEGKEFSRVVITLGYPPKSDQSRRLEFIFNGFDVESIESEEFGPGQHVVYAINLEKRVTQ